MNRYAVVLEAHLGHACIGSTRDVIEAESADAAQATALARWHEAEPGLRFAPLLTVQAHDDKEE